MSRRIRVGLIVGSLVSALTLVGLTTPASGATDKTPGVTAKQVTIGVVNPSSGSFGAQFGAYVDGVKARIYMANKAGGVNGRKLKLVIKDDAGDPTRAKTAFAQLADDPKVFGIIAGTFWIDASAADLNAKGMPVTGWGFTPSYKKYDNMFGEGPAVAPDETIGSDAVTRFAKSKGATKMANIALSDPFGPPAARVQAKIFEREGGKEVLRVLDLPLENPDFTALIQRIKDSDADYVQAGFNQQVLVQFAKAMAQADIHPKVALLGQGYQEDVLEALGPAAEDISFSLEFAPFELELPAHAQYLKGLKKVAPDTERGIQSMLGWLGAEAFIKGLEVAGKNPTRESFITNLRQVHDYDAGGLVAPFDYSTVQTSTENCFYFVTVHDGKFVPEGKKAKCGKIITGL